MKSIDLLEDGVEGRRRGKKREKSDASSALKTKKETHPSDAVGPWQRFLFARNIVGSSLDMIGGLAKVE
jgi:hypothetical protein